MIPYGRQWIDEADIQAVVDTLRSDWLTQGPAVGKLEAAFVELCHVPHAVAMNSATSALHIACLAIGAAQPCAIGGGDEGVGHRPHHIARSSADGKAGDVQGRGRAVHRARVRHAAQLGERRFQLADCGALGQPVRL